VLLWPQVQTISALRNLRLKWRACELGGTSTGDHQHLSPVLMAAENSSARPKAAFAITFTAIVVTPLAPRADEAYAVALGFSLGVVLGTVGAAIIGFAALPTVETFLGFCIMIGLYLIPVGAGVAQPWQTAVFIGMTYNFIPLLAPANQMTYDTVQFYNSALAIGVGSAAGAMSFRLLPPLSPPSGPAACSH
jgi:uncharacterized membrane protein YccC